MSDIDNESLTPFIINSTYSLVVIMSARWTDKNGDNDDDDGHGVEDYVVRPSWCYQN